jgi:PadR family transcriptional regulator PadR
MVKKTRTDLLQGTLDMLILKALSSGPMHGWSVSKRIEQVSHETLQIKQGSLYPALHRLESKGFIAANWGVTDDNRRAKFYELTTSGKKQLEDEQSYWELFAEAVNAVLAMP